MSRVRRFALRSRTMPLVTMFAILVLVAPMLLCLCSPGAVSAEAFEDPCGGGVLARTFSNPAEPDAIGASGNETPVSFCLSASCHGTLLAVGPTPSVVFTSCGLGADAHAPVIPRVASPLDRPPALSLPILC